MEWMTLATNRSLIILPRKNGKYIIYIFKRLSVPSLEWQGHDLMD